MLERRLRCHEYAADVDVEDAIHLFQRGLLGGFRNGRAGIVHKNVESAQCRNGFFDCGFAGLGIRCVRLNRDRLSARTFNRFNDGRSRVGTFVYVMATLAPYAARRLAIAAPMPREPPVMSAIFPSNFFDMIHLLELDICSSGMSQILLLAQTIPFTTLDYASSQ